MRFYVKIFLSASALFVTACIAALLWHLLMPRNFVIKGSKVTLQLGSGDFECPVFPPTDKSLQQAQGIIILATGDGGWSYWEDRTARFLADHGFFVVGWDCRKFADSRKFNQKDLSEGFNSAVAVANAALNSESRPVWYAGWSTGAEQAVAAAASVNCNNQVIGLLLAAPGKRGRYGLLTSDLLGIMPTGEGSFALSEFGDQLRQIHVAQFAAGLDPLDDTSWLETLKSPHRLYELPNTLHDMGGAGAEFQKMLLDAIAWSSSSLE